jgi:hypothetical protein
MGAAEESAVCFDTMTQHAATAVAAGGSELMDRAFERVERVGLTRQLDLEGLVVGIAATVAFAHDLSSIAD